jgi:methyl-accepting chemotaxis protein
MRSGIGTLGLRIERLAEGDLRSNDRPVPGRDELALLGRSLEAARERLVKLIGHARQAAAGWNTRSTTWNRATHA